MTPLLHGIKVEKQLRKQYFDTLSDLLFSPYVPIQVIPVGVERSNGTPTGKSRLSMSMKCKIYMKKGSFRGSGTSLPPNQYVMKSSVVIVGI